MSGRQLGTCADGREDSPGVQAVIDIGIVGGTRNTGMEMLPIIARHPHANLRGIASRKEAGMRVDRTFPRLRGKVDLTFTEHVAVVP